MKSRIIIIFSFLLGLSLILFIFTITACNSNPVGIGTTNFIYITNITGISNYYITKDTIWSGNYKIFNNILIEEDATLIISDNTTIEFYSSVFLYNHGNIIATKGV